MQKIEGQQRNLENLKKAEKQLAITAEPVDKPVLNGNSGGNSGASAVTVSGARPFAVAGKKLVPTDYLWRALTVAVKHHVEGRQRGILEVLKSTYGEDEPTRVVMANLVTKAAVAPADTVTTHWAPELVQTVIGNLIDSLFPVSIYPALAAKGGSFTFGRNGVISLPKRDPTPTLAGGFVAQGAAIPVKAASFTSITLTPKKIGVITTLTREISEHSTPSIEAIVRQAILDDTGVAIDTVLTDATVASLIRPAGSESRCRQDPRFRHGEHCWFHRRHYWLGIGVDRQHCRQLASPSLDHEPWRRVESFSAADDDRRHAVP